MSSNNYNVHSMFYDSNWEAQHDEEFLKILRREAQGDDSCVPLNNSKFLQRILICAQVALEEVFQTDYFGDFVERRFNQLVERNRALKSILGYPAICWYKDTNMFEGDESVWEYLSKTNHFVNAYRQHGEPMWKEFQYVFGEPLIRAYIITSVKLPIAPSFVSGSENNYDAHSTTAAQTGNARKVKLGKGKNIVGSSVASSPYYPYYDGPPY